MQNTTLASWLIKVMVNDGFSIRLLRDWEWFQGHPLTPTDFTPENVLRYLHALQEILTVVELERVRIAIDVIWQKGYAHGLLTTYPELWLAEHVNRN